MMNEGTMRRIFANFWPRQLPHVQDIWVRATFADVSPLLFVLTGGVITGVVILVIETIIIRLRKKKRKISNVRTSDNDLKKKFHY